MWVGQVEDHLLHPQTQSDSHGRVLIREEGKLHEPTTASVNHTHFYLHYWRWCESSALHSRCWQTGYTCPVPSTFLILGSARRGSVRVWRERERTQPGLPTPGSAAKTIICDRSAGDDSLPRDSLTPSDDQNRKKLTERRVKVSEWVNKWARHSNGVREGSWCWKSVKMCRQCVVKLAIWIIACRLSIDLSVCLSVFIYMYLYTYVHTYI